MTDEHLTAEQQDQLTDELVEKVAWVLAPFSGSPLTCTSAKLAELLGVEDGPTHPLVRAAITEALRRGLAPICATSSGYFVAREAEQVDQYAHELEARANAIMVRAGNVRHAWYVAKMGGRA